MEPAPSSDTLWERANQRWSRDGDAAAAVELLDELLAREPAHGAALNFAGWLRTTALAETAFERGLAQLKAALAVEDPDARAPANLVHALAKGGRAAEARALLEGFLAAHPHHKQGWNSLGWLQGVEQDDLAAARASLRRAVALDASYGDARLNLARVCLKAQQLDEALEHLQAAVRSGTCWRPHEAWARLGEACAAKGWLRRALEALRRSTEVDQRGEYTLATDTNIAAMTQVLSQRGQYFPHPHESGVHARRFEQWREGLAAGALPSFRELADEARRLKGGRAEGALEAVIACLDAGALLPQYSGQSMAQELEATGDEALAAFSAKWREAFQALYAELLEREEALPEPSAAQGRAEQAAAERRWGAALEALEGVQRESTEQAVTFTADAAERYGDMAMRVGDRAMALRLYALAENAAAQYASWSTSGGEGTARMVDVTRLRSKVKAISS